MKTGVISEDFQRAFSNEGRFGNKKIFDGIKAIGFDGVDYTIGYTGHCQDPIFSEARGVWVKKFGDVAAALRSSGLTAFQTHATFPTDRFAPGEFDEKCLDLFRKEIEVTAMLGAPYIVIHPINIAVNRRRKDEDFAANMRAFEMLDLVLSEFGVKLGVENMFAWDSVRHRNCPTGCSAPEDMIAYIDGAHSPNFVGCLDTGHMFINAIEPAEAVRTLGSRLKLLHVHDNDGSHDLHAAPGTGKIDWADFARALGEVGYDGAVCLETSFKPAGKIAPELMWDYARFAYAVARKIADIAEATPKKA